MRKVEEIIISLMKAAEMALPVRICNLLVEAAETIQMLNKLVEQKVPTFENGVPGVDYSKPSALPSTPDRFVPTHEHFKGGLYKVLCSNAINASNDAGETPAPAGRQEVVYTDADGKWYVRHKAEFFGLIERFKPL